ncbi:MAG: hypothetical protein M9894_20940 [Planctomycetes bacterium]|nr:hypothetical protein [Planctomycetota bacterium]
MSPKDLKIVRAARDLLQGALDPSAGTAAFEERLLGLLSAVGRECVEEHLEGLSPEDTFEENGVTWRVAHRGEKKFMTTFGWVTVERPLFRSERNGPTRCLVSERAGLFQDKWTPRAAKLAALATAELPFARAEELFQQLGGMAPSKTLLQRLDRTLLALWEADREKLDARLRRGTPIPKSAALVVVSLDGVMVNMIGSGRAEKKARTKAKGICAKGPAGYKAAAIGVLSLYDAAGARIATWRMGRMPEQNKTAVKAWLRAELQWVRRQRPDIRVVGAADGAVDNWSFLESLDPDIQKVVDYFHTVECLTRELDKANGPHSLDTQKKLGEMKRLLLEEKDGARRAFAKLDRIRQKAGMKPRLRKPRTGRYRTFYDHHRDRMDYATLREEGVPIGTGVTEGTCRYLVVDRLRRSGMTWSAEGGQAVLNLRSLVVSERFEAGWRCLVEANRRRLGPCA